MKTINKAIAVALALLVGACDEGQETPETQIYVLVDLSQTWVQPGKKDRNAHVLQEVGHGIALAATDLETPISVQYRKIGANSLESEPLCDVVYRPRLAPTRSDIDYEVRSRSDFTSYLADTCKRKIEEQSPEGLTEIRTAIASVANQPVAGASSRQIVVISDFLEESRAPVSLEADLSSFHVVLVYRPVAEDLNNASNLKFRLDAWKAELEAKGATVEALPDTGLRRAVIASYLTEGHPQ